jgi:DNA processing protein
VRYAREFGYITVKQGFVVVSGYARGVDVAAHLGAVEASGATIAVLAEGTESFRVRRELRGKLDRDNFLAVSPFAPEARWTAWRAMERNRYIVGLSRGLFVIEARERGGTFEAGLECLRQGKQLWVIDYEHGGPHREGNAKLIAAGGVPIRSGRVLKKLLKDAWEVYQPRQERLALSLTES